MPLYTADALILRTYKLGEADRIVVFLTRDRGKKRGVANGVVLGVVAAAVAWTTRGSPVLGLVLCAAMIINMFVAATAGTLVPLGLRAANVDPALASSVFITTLTDVFGFFSFLGLATVFMRYLAPGG